jgi:peroxiredoxin family protein
MANRAIASGQLVCVNFTFCALTSFSQSVTDGAKSVTTIQTCFKNNFTTPTGHQSKKIKINENVIRTISTMDIDENALLLKALCS